MSDGFTAMEFHKATTKHRSRFMRITSGLQSNKEFLDRCVKLGLLERDIDGKYQPTKYLYAALT